MKIRIVIEDKELNAHFASIEGSKELVSIGINEKGFIGFKMMEGEEVHSWDIDVYRKHIYSAYADLLRKVPEEVAHELTKVLIRHYQYDFIQQNMDESIPLFESESIQDIYNPFYDETLRDVVDPLDYYGLERMLTAIQNLSRDVE
ncbi:hypothetical protein [Paenibacillus glucanolyticus]|uniref:hypothetical protein n=1 Tax=Paenibacillus glucanolyticus TaxID=59843 RepID=UPI00096D53DA|nr:hypothetical protein [Paenibacillus glucanolyticus]OMF76669.1 hypothetical protein BK142_14185 [Paenibacillus glucanolyticus]